MIQIVDIQSRPGEAVRSVARYVAAEPDGRSGRGATDCEVPAGVASSMKSVVLIPEPGFDELPLVPSLAVNDHDRILLASRSHESQLVVMRPVIEPALPVL